MYIKDFTRFLLVLFVALYSCTVSPPTASNDAEEIPVIAVAQPQRPSRWDAVFRGAAVGWATHFACTVCATGEMSAEGLVNSLWGAAAGAVRGYWGTYQVEEPHRMDVSTMSGLASGLVTGGMAVLGRLNSQGKLSMVALRDAPFSVLDALDLGNDVAFGGFVLGMYFAPIVWALTHNDAVASSAFLAGASAFEGIAVAVWGGPPEICCMVGLGGCAGANVMRLLNGYIAGVSPELPVAPGNTWGWLQGKVPTFATDLLVMGAMAGVITYTMPWVSVSKMLDELRVSVP